MLSISGRPTSPNLPITFPPLHHATTLPY